MTGTATEIAARIAGDVERAAERIRPHLRETPVVASPWLSRRAGADVHLKAESLQVTGSFKARGAMNRILGLDPGARERGVVAASTGNHALGVAHALRVTGVDGTIFLPEDVAASKLAALERYPVRLVRHGKDPRVAEERARRVAEEEGRTYVSPYNDPLVVAGQGTIGEEISRQLDDVDAVFVAVGGGGLISGIAGFLKERAPDVEIVGCLPARSPVMYASVQAGEIVEMEVEPTLSDGTAGGVEAGAVTFDACRALVDRWFLVDEDEIAAGIREVLLQDHLVVEGAAAVPVAALLREAGGYRGRRVVCVLCGGNIARETLCEVLCDGG